MDAVTAMTRLIGEIDESIRVFWNVPRERARSAPGPVVAFPCDFLPFEILSAFGITPLVLPYSIQGENQAGLVSRALNAPDLYAAPVPCCLFKDGVRGTQSLSVDGIPPVPGEASIGAWRSLIESFIDSVVTGTAASAPDRWRLRNETEKYNTLRRAVRGIAALRAAKPSSMRQVHLLTVFRGALSLPFDIIYPIISRILDAINKAPETSTASGLPSMVSGCSTVNPEILDALEAEGFLINEDDLCGGRRSFDLSHNPDSDDLYGEILHAFSFRPLCPCLRGTGDRFELLYRLAGSYGIETIIMLDGGECPMRKNQIGETRVRLMRSGIDPLVLTAGKEIEEARMYIRNASA